jgi:hypothetical protein
MMKYQRADPGFWRNQQARGELCSNLLWLEQLPNLDLGFQVWAGRVTETALLAAIP